MHCSTVVTAVTRLVSETAGTVVVETVQLARRAVTVCF